MSRRLSRRLAALRTTVARDGLKPLRVHVGYSEPFGSPTYFVEFEWADGTTAVVGGARSIRDAIKQAERRTDWIGDGIYDISPVPS